MKVRAEAVVKGEVQRVGYRDVVQSIARKLALTGMVENVKPYDVRIICEGEKRKVEEFLKQIRVREYPINVEEIAVKFSDFKGEYGYFEIKRGDMTDELGERMDAARKDFNKLLWKQDQMLGKQDIVIEKQDVMIGKQDELRHDVNKNFSTTFDRYGEISKRLVVVTEKLELLLERSEKDRREFRDAVKELAAAIVSLAKH